MFASVRTLARVCGLGLWAVGVVACGRSGEGPAIRVWQLNDVRPCESTGVSADVPNVYKKQALFVWSANAGSFRPDRTPAPVTTFVAPRATGGEVQGKLEILVDNKVVQATTFPIRLIEGPDTACAPIQKPDSGGSSASAPGSSSPGAVVPLFNSPSYDVIADGTTTASISVRPEYVGLALKTTPPRTGFGGVCIETAGSPVDLSGYRRARVDIESAQAHPEIHIKLEKARLREARDTGWLYTDRIESGRQHLSLSLDTVDRAMLREVKKVCVAMRAAGFGAGVNNTELRIHKIEFEGPEGSGGTASKATGGWRGVGGAVPPGASSPHIASLEPDPATCTVRSACRITVVLAWTASPQQGTHPHVLVLPMPGDPGQSYWVQSLPQPRGGGQWVAQDVYVGQPGDRLGLPFRICAVVTDQELIRGQQLSALPSGPSHCVNVSRGRH